jgi:uncharacterized protein (DUF305 family)
MEIEMPKKTALLAHAVGTAMLALLLAACATTPGTTGDTSSTPAPQGNETREAVAHNQADTEFAQMMIVHHQGALEMADMMISRASSEQVRALSERISSAQGPEIDLMVGWLDAWGEAQPDGMDMGGMDHGGMDMEGMSQQEAMMALSGVEGSELDRMFLEMMIAHHQGAIEMSQTHIAAGQNADALALAQAIIVAQEAEIAEMELLLTELS